MPYLTTASQLAQLYDVARDDEVTVLDDLARRAGLIWTCPACRWNNEEGNVECLDCGEAQREPEDSWWER